MLAQGRALPREQPCGRISPGSACPTLLDICDLDLVPMFSVSSGPFFWPRHHAMTDDWSHEETSDPLHADRRNFYKVEKWSGGAYHSCRA
jgi:hypothetical protein